MGTCASSACLFLRLGAGERATFQASFGGSAEPPAPPLAEPHPEPAFTDEELREAQLEEARRRAVSKAPPPCYREPPLELRSPPPALAAQVSTPRSGKGVSKGQGPCGGDSDSGDEGRTPFATQPW